MPSNVIQLPRARQLRSGTVPLGLFVRVGRNDHLEMLHMITTGERGIFGFVIDAQNIDRHRDLVTEARRYDFDVILDPKTQQMGFPGGQTDRLAALPWGLPRHANISDFDGREGQQRAAQVVEFALANNFTQILGPTHVMSGPNDPWLRRDISMMNWTAEQIDRSGVKVSLIYSLALPIGVLRRASERRAIIAAIADARCDAIWLKVENYGASATGEKTSAYIEASRDFHARGLPVIGDQIGGLPGLATLAFGAVGGISHGVTRQQSFTTTSWRNPPEPGGGGGSGWRVYIPQLDILLKPIVAETLLATSTRVQALCGCRDTHCCPRPQDMFTNPARHAIYQRARQVERLGHMPQSTRPGHYLDEYVRRVSGRSGRRRASVNGRRFEAGPTEKAKRHESISADNCASRGGDRH